MAVVDDGMATFENGQRTVFECGYQPGGSLSVEVVNPDYDNPPDVRVGLMSVRAADDIIVRYDFERDGWSIRMDRTREQPGLMEVVEEAVEVAFVPAWNED